MKIVYYYIDIYGQKIELLIDYENSEYTTYVDTYYEYNYEMRIHISEYKTMLQFCKDNNFSQFAG